MNDKESDDIYLDDETSFHIPVGVMRSNRKCTHRTTTDDRLLCIVIRCSLFICSSDSVIFHFTHLSLPLLQINGVLAVHEFHVWQLAGDRIIASAHIRCRNLTDYMQIAEKVKEFFHNEGIHSTTIQPEFVDIESIDYKVKDDDSDCVLDCPDKSGNCIAQTCCGPQKGKSDSAKSSNGLLNQLTSVVTSPSSTTSTPNLTVKNGETFTGLTASNSQSALNNIEFNSVTPSDREKSKSAEDIV